MVERWFVGGWSDPVEASSSGVTAPSRLELDEVMEAFARAGEAAGGSVRDVGMAGSFYYRDILLTGSRGSPHAVAIHWESGTVRVLVDTGSPSCYRVQE